MLSVILIKRKDDPEDVRDPIALTDILQGALQPKRFNGTWIDDNSFHYFDANVSSTKSKLVNQKLQDFHSSL